MIAAFSLVFAAALTVSVFATDNGTGILPGEYGIDENVINGEAFKSSPCASDPDLTVVMANEKEVWFRSKKVEETLVPGTWYYADGMYIDIPVTDKSKYPSYYDTESFAKFNTEINGHFVSFIENDVTYSFIINITDLKTGKTTSVFKPYMFLGGVMDLQILDTGEILLVTRSARGWRDISVYDPADGKLICDSTGMLVSDYCINSDGEFYFVAESVIYDKFCDPVAVFATTGTAYDLSVENKTAVAKIKNMSEDNQPDRDISTVLAAKSK